MRMTPTTSPIARILAGLPTPRVAELCREAGKVALADDPRPALTATLEEAFSEQATKKKDPAELLLSQLSVPELRMIALELGVNSAGVDRNPLEERILREIAAEGNPPPEIATQPPPDLPVELWLEKQRSTVAKAEDQIERSKSRRGDRRLRAGMWGLFFIPFGAIAFSTFLEALILAWGVMVVAALVYARGASRGEAALFAVAEITVRGCFFTPLFSYLGPGIGGMMVASLCVMEILCAVVMAIDAESAATASFQAQIELKDLRPKPSELETSIDPSRPVDPVESSLPSEADPSTGVDPFHRGG